MPTPGLALEESPAGVDGLNVDAGDGARPTGDVRRTVWWASAVMLATTAGLLAALLRRTGGTFVYVIDDPAIHLTVARRLAHDGTWGIVAGEFQAASSSPLWTLLLAPTQLVARGTAGELMPLVLNVLAGLWVVRLLGPDLHRALGPWREAWRRVGALVIVVVGLLFLPGLIFYGMEHTLHLALVLATILAVEHRWLHGPAGASGGADRSGAPSAPAPTNGHGRPRRPWLAGAWAPMDGSGRARRRAWPFGVPAPMDGSLRLRRRAERLPAWAPFVLIGLATLTRGESTFVAVGLAVGLVAVQLPASPHARRGRGHGDGDGGDPALRESAQRRKPPGSWLRRLGPGLGLGLASAVALAIIAGVNVVFGQGLLPNSVLAKSFGDRGDTRRSLVAALDRLVTDPLLLVLVVVAVLLLVRERRRRRERPGADPGARAPLVFPAVVLLVATTLHVILAGVEASLRYEAYLLGIGVLVLLRLLADLASSRAGGAGPLPTGGTRLAGSSARAHGHRLAGAVLVLMLVPAAWQVHRTLVVPREAGILWEQRYQVARFLDRAYDSEPIAIGELGYIGLYHDGPLTDVYGLGDHEVLQATLDDRKGTGFWRELQARRDFPVLVTYDFSLAGQHPPEWFLVATWRSPDAYYEVTQFWATVPDEVVDLRRQLEAFQPELPDGVEVTYNEWAPFAAAAQVTQEPETPPAP